MRFESPKMLKSFFLFAVLMLLVAGCGGSGSSTSAASVDTGSIVAKLVWNVSDNSSQATTAKALLLPGIVKNIKIIVSGPGIATPMESSLIDVAAGGGTMSGIPLGSSRTVTVQGLDANNLIAYQGQKTDITINPGPNDAGTINMASSSPVTTASPTGGTYGSAQNVTLTSNSGATIYYTTNGTDPIVGTSASGVGQISNISIAADTVLKFFAVLTGITPETIKTQTYTITGSVTVNVTAI